MDLSRVVTGDSQYYQAPNLRVVKRDEGSRMLLGIVQQKMKELLDEKQAAVKNHSLKRPGQPLRWLLSKNHGLKRRRQPLRWLLSNIHGLKRPRQPLRWLLSKNHGLMRPRQPLSWLLSKIHGLKRRRQVNAGCCVRTTL
ncbi:hypothetical protein PoB_004198800 [Plakobranchus ocellatus]|uniref:Uncharacterized protein n=1 Tax=Plakobranchus ocellatus TaxID=259542 RepID=A0AAV4B8K1_9GAST|nr:hypothetical protein PoB_004198800 [Plakobranchus ocellatus]